MSVHLNPKQMTSYTGEYYSSELDIFHRIVLDEGYNGLVDSDQNESQFKVYLLTIN